MSPIRRFDHVGITVSDIDTVTAFFVGLGFETESRTVLESEFLDTVIGMPDSRTEIVMLRPPGGEPGWNCRGSSAQATQPARPTPRRTSRGCAT
jgi:catechol 2,3-dioxygenase-like lactoylglutathione lyase family enzyme